MCANYVSTFLAIERECDIMKKKVIIAAMVLLAMFFACLGGSVRAAYEVDSPKLPIETIIKLENDDETKVVLKDNLFEYELTPVTEGAPLPSTGKIEDGKWIVSVAGDYSECFVEPINFTRPGIYKYTFKAIPGTYEYVDYDEMVYTIYYDISNNDAYDSLEAKVIITNKDENIKYDSLTFTNIYHIPEEPPEDEKSVDTSDISVWMYVGLFAGLVVLGVSQVKRIKE